MRNNGDKVTFPKAFKNECLTVIIQDTLKAPDNPTYFGYSSLTKESFLVSSSFLGGDSFMCIAIGY